VEHVHYSDSFSDDFETCGFTIHTEGGVLLEELALRVSGPHPGFEMSEDEFCAVITPLLS
jgi:hypothetical protein